MDEKTNDFTEGDVSHRDGSVPTCGPVGPAAGTDGLVLRKAVVDSSLMLEFVRSINIVIIMIIIITKLITCTLLSQRQNVSDPQMPTKHTKLDS